MLAASLWLCLGAWWRICLMLLMVFVLVFFVLGLVLDEPESLILAQSERWRHA